MLRAPSLVVIQDLKCIVWERALKVQTVFAPTQPFEAFVWIMQYDRHGFFMHGAHHVIRLGREEGVKLPVPLFP